MYDFISLIVVSSLRFMFQETRFGSGATSRCLYGGAGYYVRRRIIPCGNYDKIPIQSVFYELML